ncbi:unnamed protein product, partial [Rotaria sp. Silwood2]
SRQSYHLNFNAWNFLMIHVCLNSIGIQDTFMQRSVSTVTRAMTSTASKSILLVV